MSLLFSKIIQAKQHFLVTFYVKMNLNSDVYLIGEILKGIFYITFYQFFINKPMR